MTDFTPEYYLKRIKQNALNPDVACGYEAITITNTVKRLTIPANSKYALMKLVSDATGNAVNYLEFLLPVTSSTGIPIADGTAFDVSGAQNLAAFNAIQIQAGTHVLHVQYYK